MSLLLPKNTPQGEPAAVAPVSSGVWVDSEGYLQLEFKSNKFKISASTGSFQSQVVGKECEFSLEISGRVELGQHRIQASLS